MTKSEYTAAYKAARNRTTLRIDEEMKALQEIYKDASEQVAARVARAELLDQSRLTIDSKRAIQNQLEAEAQRIALAIEQGVPDAVSRQYLDGIAPIDTLYIRDAALRADVGGRITEAGLDRMAQVVNFNLVRSTINRQFGQYSFSQSVWNTWRISESTGLRIPTGIFGDYQTRIQYLINAGLAQGRDPIKIADDITTYVRDIGAENGVEAVFKPGRYGRLDPESRRYAQRIPRRIDWRALRLVRSELYASIQDAGIRQAAFNPAVTGMVNWKKQPGNPIDCCADKTNNGQRCIDLQAASPYKIDEAPVYNHANCSCWIEPVLMDQREFVADLKKWIDQPDSVGYINEWYTGKYLPAQV
jgi:hypothetical protein